MNIENNFAKANSYLEKAKKQFRSRNFDIALVSLSKVMSQTRETIEKIYKLQARMAKVEDPK